jgi:hypothetical protein
VAGIGRRQISTQYSRHMLKDKSLQNMIGGRGGRFKSELSSTVIWPAITITHRNCVQTPDETWSRMKSSLAGGRMKTYCSRSLRLRRSATDRNLRTSHGFGYVPWSNSFLPFALCPGCSLLRQVFLRIGDKCLHLLCRPKEPHPLSEDRAVDRVPFDLPVSCQVGHNTMTIECRPIPVRPGIKSCLRSS